MDFQSAARFGERRVMVTDYDETAVEVNAKVVDEDTGEVICECESGGGGGVTTAILKVAADSNAIENIRVLATGLGGNPNGYFVPPAIRLNAKGELPIVLINGEMNVGLDSNNITVEGDAEVVTYGTNRYLHITGNCEIKAEG